MAKKKTTSVALLKGWTAIAKFLGTSPASAQGWAKQGMPVKREGRFTIADSAEVQAWLGTAIAHAEACAYPDKRVRSDSGAQRLAFNHEKEEVS